MQVTRSFLQDHPEPLVFGTHLLSLLLPDAIAAAAAAAIVVVAVAVVAATMATMYFPKDHDHIAQWTDKRSIIFHTKPTSLLLLSLLLPLFLQLLQQT